jgi:signal transduction histidine kinase/CheY-like chemotaxis protein
VASRPILAVERRAAGSRLAAWQSLRVRLPLVITAVLVLAVVTFLWAAYREVELTLVRAAGYRAKNAADQVANLVERSSLASMEIVRRSAADAAVRRFVRNPTGDGRDVAERRLTPLAIAGVLRIELWSAAGSRVLDVPIPATGGAAANLTPPTIRPREAGFKAIQAAGDVVFTEAAAEILDEPSPATEAVPAHLGYLVVRSTLSVTPAGALGQLVGADALIDIGNAAGGTWTDFSRVVSAPPVDVTREGVAEYRAANGERRIGGVSRIRGTPWAVWVAFPRSATIFPAQAFLRRMIVVAVLYLVVGALLTASLSIRITNPIHELALAANAIAAGDYSRRVFARRGDEIGQLGEAFNAMSAEVKSAADALRTSRETFAATLSSIHDGVAVTDARGNLVYVNPMAERILGTCLIGKPPEAWTPQPGSFFQTGKVVSKDEGALVRALKGEEVRDVEIFGRNENLPDGAYINVNAGPLRDSDGMSRGAWVSFRDVSTQRRLDEERVRTAELELRGRESQHANELKSEFLANMSHELRTPLNAIIGFAELMHRGKVGPVSPEHQEYLGDILMSSKHLLHIINDVLDLAKVESGKMEFRAEAVDLATLVNEVRDGLRTLAAGHGLHVETDVDPDVTAAIVDPARVKQILYNYLSNAIKFTPDGGRVSVRVTREGSEMFGIRVEDTGIGIPADQLGRLFVEFQQLDAGAAKKHQGTGLGLALTKRLVEAQGGQVAVRSTPGEGSTFSAILPLRMTMVLSDTGRAIPRVAPGNRTVLVVDDDPATLKLADLALRELGHRPVCKNNAVDALLAAVADPPAVVIVDLLMPHVDGFEFIARFRASPAGHHVPILVWTVKDLDAADRLRLQTSAAAVVSKRAGGARALVEELGRLLPAILLPPKRGDGA